MLMVTITRCMRHTPKCYFVSTSAKHGGTYHASGEGEAAACAIEYSQMVKKDEVYLILGNEKVIDLIPLEVRKGVGK